MNKFDLIKNADKSQKARNDCTVWAYAKACDVSYNSAWEIMKLAGRRNNGGIYFHQWFLSGGLGTEKLTEVSVTLLEMKDLRHTVASFTAANPKGRYILLVLGHALSLIDGVLHSNQWDAKQFPILWKDYGNQFLHNAYIVDPSADILL